MKPVFLNRLHHTQFPTSANAKGNRKAPRVLRREKISPRYLLSVF
uniref:Uncharacterized protein n=1 Tax=Rhizophora mucronata TaxID=61149 RepID=A0A2P2J6Q1_RHIMU